MTDVSVPLARALITGALVSCVVVVLAVWLAVWLRLSFLLPLGGWFVTLSGVTTWQWLRHTAPAPPLPPAPSPPAPLPSADPPPLRITVSTKAPGNTDPDKDEPGDVIETFGLHVSPATLRAIIRSVESGAHKWSYRSLAAIPGVSETVAVRLLDEMLAAGLLEYRNGQKNHPRGHSLSASGRAMSRRLVESG